jgi:hypothetical protein
MEVLVAARFVQFVLWLFGVEPDKQFSHCLWSDKVTYLLEHCDNSARNKVA